MRKVCAIFFLCSLCSAPAVAEIASVQYVDNKLDTKLEISANAEQTMAGDYVVTGTLKVPTQPLPVAQ